MLLDPVRGPCYTNFKIDFLRGRDEHEKRGMSLLLTLALLLGLCSPAAGLVPSAQAAGGTYGVLTYTIDTDQKTVTITDCAEDASGSVVVPAMIDGYPVTNIGKEAFKGCRRITSVVLPEGLEQIGADAFNGTGIGLGQNTLEINIPTTVRSIGDLAFAFTSIQDIVIPEGVTYIGYATFWKCYSLRSVTIPESVKIIVHDAFYFCDGLKNVYYSGSWYDWTHIEIGEDNDYLKNARVHCDYIYPAVSTPEPEPEPEPEEVTLPTPTLKAVENKTDGICLTWNADFYLPGIDVDTLGYQVLRKTDGGSWKTIATLTDLSTGAYTDTNVEMGKTYTYTVRIFAGDRLGDYDSTGKTITRLAEVDASRMISDGTYNLTFRTDSQDYDISYGFYYSEGFFTKSAYEYNQDLAVMTLGLVMSGFSARPSDKDYLVAGNVGRERNIARAHETLGFGGGAYYNYDVPLDAYADKVAFSLAYKNVSKNGQTYTLIPVIVRGGGYGAEWSSNFKVGTGSRHEGFYTAAKEVVDTTLAYVDDLKEKGLVEGDVKLWIGGYSRGAAVANLAAASLVDSGDFKQKDIFAYTFATPTNTTSASKNYDNIFNLVNSCDLVPCVPLADWGYTRYGETLYLPGTKVTEEAAALSSLYAAITGTGYDFSGSQSFDGVKDLTAAAGQLIKTTSEYVGSGYQQLFKDYMAISNMIPEGHLPDALAKYYGISVTDAGKLMVKAANNLEGLGVNDDIYAAALPLFSVLHAQDTNVAENLANTLDGNALRTLALLTSGIAAGVGADFSGVGMNHYPEVYLALLKYYGDSDLSSNPKVIQFGLFLDVKANDWFYDAIHYVQMKGLMSGTSATAFTPNGTMSRAMLATVLYRMEGQPEVSYSETIHIGEGVDPDPYIGDFTDVKPDMWYSDAIMWANQQGIVSGYDEDTFGTNDPVTREQLVTMLFRYAKTKTNSFIYQDYNNYKDANRVSPWASKAMRWAMGHDIISGTSRTTLSPQNTATRAQCATILMRFVEQ